MENIGKIEGFPKPTLGVGIDDRIVVFYYFDSWMSYKLREPPCKLKEKQFL